MRRYIYGFDENDPRRCARLFREKGIGAVVTGASGAVHAPVFADEGIDMYLCFGAHGLGSRSSESRLCLDAFDTERIWFSSGCPNNNVLREANLSAVTDAYIPGIKGIFVDGARFASFASVEGPESFFTCFCPECMDKMSLYGMDAKAVRGAVRRLREKHILPGDDAHIADWLRFRSFIVKAYMDDFSSRVHSLNSDLLAGAFIFEPDLAPFVGQTFEACASLDIIAPMLYRNYPHKNGPACMGHEWAALISMFSSAAPDLLRIAGVHTTLSADTAAAEQLMRSGFSPADVGLRVANAKNALKPGQVLWPIIQIEDERLCETELAAFKNGAEAVGYFMYGMAELN